MFQEVYSVQECVELKLACNFNIFKPSLFPPPVVSRMTSGAAVDRYESDRQQHTAVINFLDTTRGKRVVEEESRSVGATTVEYGQEGEEEEYNDEYYYEDEYEDGMSGDYEVEMPQGERVKFFIFANFSLLSQFSFDLLP